MGRQLDTVRASAVIAVKPQVVLKLSKRYNNSE